jgi:NitT/TauT family transport system substrate-binding protein
MKKTRMILALAATASLVLTACTTGGGGSAAPSAAPSTGTASAAPSTGTTSAAPTELTPVSLQLQWTPQAQFAGYFAAKEQGYFEAAGLDVTFLDGGPTVVPQQVGSAPDGPEFTIAWQPKVLEAREAGSDLVNIAQIFQRSGTLSVSWKATNITGPADFAGKKVGVWDFGNEYEVTAGAKKAGLEQGTDYEKVIQPFDMTLLLSKQIDVAEAMIYNEYAQVLEATNPETGALYQPTDLNVINWNDEGTAMLQDALFARAAWLAEGENAATATAFLKASFQGWVFCRDNPADCIEFTVNAGSQLPAGHQAWMMNEVNPLIWPSTNSIGVMDPTLWQQTVDVSLGAGIIKAAPPADAFRTDLAEAALAELGDVDTTGASFVKGTVEVTPGGN